MTQHLEGLVRNLGLFCQICYRKKKNEGAILSTTAYGTRTSIVLKCFHVLTLPCTIFFSCKWVFFFINLLKINCLLTGKTWKTKPFNLFPVSFILDRHRFHILFTFRYRKNIMFLKVMNMQQTKYCQYLLVLKAKINSILLKNVNSYSGNIFISFLFILRCCKITKPETFCKTKNPHIKFSLQCYNNIFASKEMEKYNSV